MTNVLPLFQSHSATSKAAAESIMPKVGTLRRQVLDYIRMQGPHGATDEEIQDGLDMNPSTQRPRRIELSHPRKGHPLVFDRGRRLTKSGREAMVWVANIPLCEEE